VWQTDGQTERRRDGRVISYSPLSILLCCRAIKTSVTMTPIKRRNGKNSLIVFPHVKFPVIIILCQSEVDDIVMMAENFKLIMHSLLYTNLCKRSTVFSTDVSLPEIIEDDECDDSTVDLSYIGKYRQSRSRKQRSDNTSNGVHVLWTACSRTGRNRNILETIDRRHSIVTAMQC